MRIFPEPIGFDWDQGNLTKNLEKHKVTTQEAEEMFATEPFISRRDLYHSSNGEVRHQALGKTRAGRKLFVAFTIRERKIRVISIRDMTPTEEAAYEKLERNS